MMTDRFEQIVERIGAVVLGKHPQIRLALACLFARGHLLIEDMPGIGKTTLAKVLARCLGLAFQRVQFTSDMLPGDILGVSIFDQQSGSFYFHPGPVFTHVLLVDEINRAMPKTQSALLEAMEEGQVTVEGETRPLQPPFFVIATQNPLEYAGTFPLPESQMDRFLMRITVGYPDREAEKSILRGAGTHKELASVDAAMTKDEVAEIQDEISRVHLSDAFLSYLQDIIAHTRNSPHFHAGISPRGGIALSMAARSWAYMPGRDYAVPEDLKAVLLQVAGHRLRSAKDRMEMPENRLLSIFSEVDVPV